MFSLSGHIIDIISGTQFKGTVQVKDGKIESIKPELSVPNRYIMPGFVDAHVHIESSMLVPSEFARLAVTHGTLATVSDPHEIANVVGIRGVDYMIDNAKQVPFYFNFGAPSCVPATGFETAGAYLGPEEIEQLLKRDEIRYLSEMMNYPGVLHGDKEVLEKIKIAQKYNKPVDGHAPGLRGEDAKNYIAAGISTDHECFTKEEALEKIKYGMKILIREGSAAKNFDALIELIADYPDKIMFCSDDKHPDALAIGHINQLVQRAVSYGFKYMDVLRAAILNPVKHYNLQHGLLQVGGPADFIVVNDLKNFEVLATYIKGIEVSSAGLSLIQSVETGAINNFNCKPIHESELAIHAETNKIRVIEAIDGQLITKENIFEAKIENGNAVSDIERDLLKMVVINRYSPAPPAFAFVKNFGLKDGAIASTVAHDSHNIIAVGADDASLARAINLLVENKGGISLVSKMEQMVQALPVGGLMSNEDGYEVAAAYQNMDKAAKALGSKLGAPYMTLSFLALLVIPQLKLSDKGLFDGGSFKFTGLFV